MPVEVLGRMLNWPHIARIWLPAWLANPDAVLDGFETSLTSALSEVVRHSTGSPEQSPQDRVEPSEGEPEAAQAGRDHEVFENLDREYASIADDDPDPWQGVLGSSLLASLGDATESHVDLNADEFKPWVAGYLGSRDVLDTLDRSASARARVRRSIKEAIAEEGPIHQDRLVKLVAAAFDLNRVSANRAASILGIVPRVHYKGDEPEIFWAASVDPATWDFYRRDAGGSRPLEHVPLMEVANAMRSLCRQSGGAERKELLRETLTEFGFKRLTQGIEARMNDALEYALKTGQLERRAGIYLAAEHGLVARKGSVATAAATGVPEMRDIVADEFDHWSVVISRQDIEADDRPDFRR